MDLGWKLFILGCICGGIVIALFVILNLPVAEGYYVPVILSEVLPPTISLIIWVIIVVLIFCTMFLLAAPAILDQYERRKYGTY